MAPPILRLYRPICRTLIPRAQLRHVRHNSALPWPSSRVPEFSLAGRTIVVTGGGRGIGLAQTEAILEAGASVHCFDLHPRPPEHFLKVQERASSLGASLHYHSLDVRSESSIISALSKIPKPISGLLCAAGINQEIPAVKYTPSDWQRMFDINVIGTFLCAQAVAKSMIETGAQGSIVLIASMSARVANRGLLCSAYNSSKAAVQQMARNLAAEWGAHGIRVNSLSPGYIVTEMVEMLFVEYPERRERWASENMLGRLGRVEDMRGVAVFLLSDASKFMTGSDLVIDGGHTAW